MIKNNLPIKIAPSMLSADFAMIDGELKRIHNADLIHLDVMDGIFVPNLTFGFKMIEDIKKRTDLPLDVHLMIERPQRYIQRFLDSGADYLSFHIEATGAATTDDAGKIIGECISQIRVAKVKCGVAISPDTPVSALLPFVGAVDFVLLMSVYPGFGGQKFMNASIERLREIKSMLHKNNSDALIEIDGGIIFDNIRAVFDAGVNIAVAGNTVFKAESPASAIDTLRKMCG